MNSLEWLGRPQERYIMIYNYITVSFMPGVFKKSIAPHLTAATERTSAALLVPVLSSRRIPVGSLKMDAANQLASATQELVLTLLMVGLRQFPWHPTKIACSPSFHGSSLVMSLFVAASDGPFGA